AREALTSALKTRNASTPVVYAAIETVTNEISHDVGSYGSLSKIPSAAASNLRNDMYLVLDTSRLATKAKTASQTFSADELKTVDTYQTGLE
ncbi:inorganic phosphate transporter, partial [Acinetobacter baumannii]